MNMDEKTFLDSLAAPKPPADSGVDGLFHSLDKARMKQMKAQLHASIDRLFEKIEYGPDGNAVSPINIEQKRDFDTLAAGFGRVLHVPKAESLTVRIEYTLAQVTHEMELAKARSEKR